MTIFRIKQFYEIFVIQFDEISGTQNLKKEGDDLDTKLNEISDTKHNEISIPEKEINSSKEEVNSGRRKTIPEKKNISRNFEKR